MAAAKVGGGGTCRSYLSALEMAFPMATGCASKTFSYNAILASICRERQETKRNQPKERTGARHRDAPCIGCRLRQSDLADFDCRLPDTPFIHLPPARRQTQDNQPLPNPSAQSSALPYSNILPPSPQPYPLLYADVEISPLPPPIPSGTPPRRRWCLPSFPFPPHRQKSSNPPAPFPTPPAC